MTRAVYAATLGVGLALLAWGAAAVTWPLERALFWIRSSGWLAAGLLLLAILVTPLARRLRSPSRALPSLRRALGISAAASATAHAALSLGTHLDGAWAQVASLAWLRAGALAWLVLAALWLTSYPGAVRALRVKLWKPLHRLALVAALLAFQHALLSPLAARGWVLGVFGVAAAAWLTRLIPQGRSSTPSQASSQSQT
ncbi:MAG: ferric reductase-like transmembrane domain-containing protein [Myxococcota bacterium]|nr:ferric reductase-like transmembrane domain-containing protein [Myxococcota bacterium]